MDMISNNTRVTNDGDFPKEIDLNFKAAYYALFVISLGFISLHTIRESDDILLLPESGFCTHRWRLESEWGCLEPFDKWAPMKGNYSADLSNQRAAADRPTPQPGEKKRKKKLYHSG